MNTKIRHALAKEAKAARQVLRDAGYSFSSLLAQPDANPKLEKSLKLRVLSAPLHLAPADLSGFNVCPMATQGCKAACLHTAGNPAYMRGKERARIGRTLAYFSHRQAFMVALAHEIACHEVKSRARDFKCGVRLNATSDILWEKVPVSIAGNTFPNLMKLFPRIQFYDYTKQHKRINPKYDLPKNYHLTFSLAENNDLEAIHFIDRGGNVAVAMNVKRNKPLPATFELCGRIFPVIDGDIHDFRPIDQTGVVVGLRAKGKAISDKSGFVRVVT